MLQFPDFFCLILAENQSYEIFPHLGIQSNVCLLMHLLSKNCGSSQFLCIK